MKTMIAFKVHLLDRSKWIERRVFQLYQSLNVIGCPPPAEPSGLCKHCQFKSKCESEEKSR
jgi:hypothetical protein